MTRTGAGLHTPSTPALHITVAQPLAANGWTTDSKLLGQLVDEGGPFFRIADMYIGETTCDGKKKAWEILSEDVPVYVMDLPQMKRAKDVKAWAEEIEVLKER